MVRRNFAVCLVSTAFNTGHCSVDDIDDQVHTDMYVTTINDVKNVGEVKGVTTVYE